MGETSRRRSRALLRRAMCGAVVSAALSGTAVAQPAGASVEPAPSRPAQSSNEIDLFMERVIDNRDASWRRLGDFILRETETLAFEGPRGIPLAGFRREYVWYVRDDVVVRSPVRFDGVDIDEETRREYEVDWLRQERRRRGRRDTRRRILSRRDTERNVAIAIERSWGATVSEALRERVAADADLVGDDLAAITLNTGAILEDLGGVAVVGFAETVTHTRDLFVMLDTDRLTASEVGRALRGPLARLVDRIDLVPPEDLAPFVELVQLGEHFELDARDLVPSVERAAQRLEVRGLDEVVITLNGIRTRLVARATEAQTAGAPDDAGDTILTDSARLEPRFISESYFMEFTFEPGNYYFVGRDTIAGREVVQIEYYPTDLFDDGPDANDSESDKRLARGFNKTTLVTLWIDPEAYQIVRYTVDNTGLDFLPGRWLIRVDGLEASMEMGQPIHDVWLPTRVTVSGRATMALGDFDVTFIREFFDHREAQTGGRLIGVVAPR